MSPLAHHMTLRALPLVMAKVAAIQASALALMFVLVVTPTLSLAEESKDTPKVADADKPTTGGAEKEAPAKEPSKQDTQTNPLTSIKLTCNTLALGVGVSPPKQSKGQVVISLDIDEDNPSQSTWQVTAIGDKHGESFAHYLKKSNICKDRCPAQKSKKTGDKAGWLLWAPAAKSIDKLGEQELLVIIALSQKDFEFKGSTFEGPAPLVFEKGNCEKTP